MHYQTKKKIEELGKLLQELRKQQQAANNEGSFKVLYSRYENRVLQLTQEIAASEKHLYSSCISSFKEQDFLRVVQFVAILGENMPEIEQENIAKEYRGEYVKERVLKALYRKYGLKDDVIVLVDIETICDNLLSTVKQLFTEYAENADTYTGIETSLNELLNAMAVNYTVNLEIL